MTHIRPAIVAIGASLLLTSCGGNGADAGAPESPPPSITPTSLPTSVRPPTTPGPERPGDLVRGFRNLTGTVQASKGCTILQVADRRWALTGRHAGSLRTGEDVQVRGRAVGVPHGCSAAQALEVTQLRRLR